MLRAPEFTSLLGKTESSPEVAEFSKAYGPFEAEEAPPGQKYLGSPAHGIDLLLVDGRVADVQIFVQPSPECGAFTGALPFGLRRGMTQDAVHALLGQPARFDEYDSKYEIDGGAVRVTICYDDQTLKYVSISRPKTRR